MKQGFCILSVVILLGFAGLASAEPDCDVTDENCPLTVATSTAPSQTVSEMPAETAPRRIKFGASALQDPPPIQSAEKDPNRVEFGTFKTIEQAGPHDARKRKYGSLSARAAAELARRETESDSSQSLQSREVLLDVLDVPESERDSEGQLTCKTVYSADGSETRSCSTFKTVTLSSD